MLYIVGLEYITSLGCTTAENNVITGFIISLVLNTLIYSWTLAPPDGWTGALQSAPW